MKKIIIAALLISLACLLMFSCTSSVNDPEDDGTKAPEVTNPNGFEDVTTPSTDKVTEKDPETGDPKPEDTTAPVEDDTDAPEPDDSDSGEDTDTSEPETTLPDPEKFISNAEEAVAAARAWLGETDPDTGYKYAYSYDGAMIIDETSYFRVRVSWHIEEQDRYPLLGYLLVNPNGEITKYNW